MPLRGRLGMRQRRFRPALYRYLDSLARPLCEILQHGAAADRGSHQLSRQVPGIKDRLTVERQDQITRLDLFGQGLIATRFDRIDQRAFRSGAPIACAIIQVTCCARIGNMPALTLPFSARRSSTK